MATCMNPACQLAECTASSARRGFAFASSTQHASKESCLVVPMLQPRGRLKLYGHHALGSAGAEGSVLALVS